MMNHHKPSKTIMSHHEPSKTIKNHHKPEAFHNATLKKTHQKNDVPPLGAQARWLRAEGQLIWNQLRGGGPDSFIPPRKI